MHCGLNEMSNYIGITENGFLTLLKTDVVLRSVKLSKKSHSTIFEWKDLYESCSNLPY